MTAREEAIIGGIQAVTAPTSADGAMAIAALFADERELYIQFLDPDSIEPWTDRILRVQWMPGIDKRTWAAKLLAARRAHPDAFAHLFDPDHVAA